MDYQSASSDNNCLIAFGNDVQKKCGVDQAASEAFCKANPNKLCCTASSNEVSAPTSNQSTPSQNSGNSKGINPLFIGAAAIGISLIIIMVTALFLMSRRIKTKQNEYSPDYNQKSYRDSKEPISQSRNQDLQFSPTQQFQPSQYEKTQSQGEREENMEVVFEYAANLFDELTLSIL